MASDVTEAGKQEVSPPEEGVCGQTPTEGERNTSRRRLLALLGAGGAALITSQLGRDQAVAGHDGSNVFHLGEVNFDPDTGRGTQLQADVNEFALWIENNNGGPGAGGILASAGGLASALEAYADSGIGVLGTSNSGPAVEGRSETHIGGLFSSNSGTGVRCDSQTGHGVDGRSHSDGGIGVRGEVVGNGEGVQGSSSLEGSFGQGPGTGVSGISGTGIGVDGYSDSGIGGHFFTNSGKALQVDGPASIVASVPAEQGDSLFVENQQSGGGAISGVAYGDVHAIEGVVYPDDSGTGYGTRGISSLPDGYGDGPGVGVHGQSGTGIGLLGMCVGAGTGVEARSDSPDGMALVVRGTSSFSTAGSGTIPFGQDSVFVNDPAVTAESHITATLTGNPGPVITGFPAVLQWVERQPGTGFVVHMTRRVGQATPFTYLIVEPG